MKIGKLPEKSFFIDGQWYKDKKHSEKDFGAWQMLLSQSFKINPALCYKLLELRQAGTVLKDTGELDFSNSYCAMKETEIKRELQKFDCLVPLLKKVAQHVKSESKPQAKIISVDSIKKIKSVETKPPEIKIEDTRADVKFYSPMVYRGVIPEKFEMKLAEINACAMNCEFFAVKDFYKKYGFSEIEIYALRTGYDFENHDLIFPICENIFDKKLEDNPKIKCCKIKFGAMDFEPENYQLAGVVARYVQWFLVAHDIVEKFKIDDEKKYGIIDGKKVYGLMKHIFKW